MCYVKARTSAPLGDSSVHLTHSTVHSGAEKTQLNERMKIQNMDESACNQVYMTKNDYLFKRQKFYFLCFRDCSNEIADIQL